MVQNRETAKYVRERGALLLSVADLKSEEEKEGDRHRERQREREKTTPELSNARKIRYGDRLQSLPGVSAGLPLARLTLISTG